jgi:hypothetical protein
MGDFGKVLIVLGGVLLAVGVVFVLLGRSGVPVGRLPGDIVAGYGLPTSVAVDKDIREAHTG